MPLSPAPIQQAVLSGSGILSTIWVKWIEKIRKEAHKAPVFAKANLPLGEAGDLAFVSDEVGGAVLAFSDGTHWRRVTDRAIVS